ncbi:MAG: ribonucleoside triphosphate reductase, partial [Oscillospiraceae bacterium]|nr:ribonucleoside triphosphate reductase [Oscillospiraceae bacterium]
IMQNEWAGAQAFSSFDTYLAPFVRIDNLSQKEVKQCIQSFIYGVNTPSRWGTQAPFSNITLDWTCPKDLENLPAIIGGKEMDFTYGECQKEMDMVNKAFIEIMIEGDANGRGFQYPIPTYSITRDFDWSPTENNKLLFEMTAKYGTPYFSNYINSDMEPSDVRSMCCRLRLDLRELRKKSGGFFGSGESTGSIGVVTLNMPRLAYQSRDEKDFYARLDRLMDLAARSLKTKRDVITKLLNEGLYPYTKHYLGTFANHFSTIGLVGMNEAGLNASWIRADMTDPKCQTFAKQVLDHMRERLSDYQEKYGDLYNLEATPAESTAYRFAKHDKEDFPDIITAAEAGGQPYYTNSSHLPVGYTEDIFAALDIQDDLQTRYTSGTVFHAFLGEKLPSWESAANLVRKIAENYKLPYYTLSPTYSVCKDHGYLVGEQFTCPHCGKPTEVYSRITGYYRPVQNWNAGKTQEYKERREYVIANSHLTHQGPIAEEKVEAPATFAPQEEVKGGRAILFATPTCPNCRIACQYMDKAGFPYEKLMAAEHADLAKIYGVKQAPTLIITDGENFEKIAGAGAIKQYVSTLAQ